MKQIIWKMVRVSVCCSVVIFLLGAAPDALLINPAVGTQFTIQETFDVIADVDTDPAIAVIMNKPMGVARLDVAQPGGGGYQWSAATGNVRKGRVKSTASPFCYWTPGNPVAVMGSCWVMQNPNVVTTDVVQVSFVIP